MASTNRKHRRGLERPSNKRYKTEARDVKNKKLKILRHLKKHPNDLQTPGAVVDYKIVSRKAPPLARRR